MGVETFVTAATVTMGFKCGVSVEKLTKAKDNERLTCFDAAERQCGRKEAQRSTSSEADTPT